VSAVPVTLLCHSMGCLMSLIFLQQQSAEWKAKYVLRFVSLAGPWGGSFKAVKVFAVGDTYGAFTIKDPVIRKLEISMPSLAFLLPSPLVWNATDVLASTTKRQYTVNDLEDFFNDLKYPTGYEMRKDMEQFFNLTPPGVEMHCLYGSQLPTVEALSYKSPDLTSSKPVLVTGDGDGTVNLRSLRRCTQWASQQAQPVHATELPNVDHYYAILSQPDVVEKIVQIIIQG